MSNYPWQMPLTSPEPEGPAPTAIMGPVTCLEREKLPHNDLYRQCVEYVDRTVDRINEQLNFGNFKRDGHKVTVTACKWAPPDKQIASDLIVQRLNGWEAIRLAPNGEYELFIPTPSHAASLIELERRRKTDGLPPKTEQD